MLRVLCLLLVLNSALTAAEFNAEPHLKQPIVGDKLPLEEVIVYCEQRVKPCRNSPRSKHGRRLIKRRASRR